MSKEILFSSPEPSRVVSVFKNVRERFVASNYRSVSFLTVVNKILKRLVNTRL